MSAEPLTVEEIAWLKGQVPEGIDPDHWALRLNWLLMPAMKSADHYILRTLFDAAKRREAAAKGETPGPAGVDARAWDSTVDFLRHIANLPANAYEVLAVSRGAARHILAALACYGHDEPEPPKATPTPPDRAPRWRQLVDDIARGAGMPDGYARVVHLEAPEARRLLDALETAENPPAEPDVSRRWYRPDGTYDVLESTDETIRRRIDAAREIERLRSEAQRLLDAYIHENRDLECLPERKFRAVMPAGFTDWFPTRDEARAAIGEAVAKAEGGGR